MSNCSLASARGAPSATRHAPRHARPAARSPSAFGTRRPRNSTSPTTLCRSHKPSAPAEPAPAQSRRSALALLATTTSAAASLLLLPPAPAALAKAPATDPGDWSSPGLGAPIDPAAPKFVKLPSGVRYQVGGAWSHPSAVLAVASQEACELPSGVRYQEGSCVVPAAPCQGSLPVPLLLGTSEPRPSAPHNHPHLLWPQGRSTWAPDHAPQRAVPRSWRQLIHNPINPHSSLPPGHAGRCGHLTTHLREQCRGAGGS